MSGIYLDQLTHKVFERIDNIRMNNVYIGVCKIFVISAGSRSVEVQPQKFPWFTQTALV